MAHSHKPSPALQPRRTREDVKAKLLAFFAHAEPDPSEPGARIVQVVLGDERFWNAPASAKWHHNYDGGLAEHTLEVLEGVSALCTVAALDGSEGERLDPVVTSVAALWHDYAKVFDYEKIYAHEDGPPAPQTEFWAHTKHADEQGHITAGYHLFLVAADKHGLPGDLRDAVAHCLLAHHGRREWGSPVEPQTREAWALHLADMISVRVLCNRPE